MRLKRLSIQRQNDDTFALIASVETKTKTLLNVLLSSGAACAKDLQKTYMFFLNDEESLHTEIDFHLLRQEAV